MTPDPESIDDSTIQGLEPKERDRNEEQSVEARTGNWHVSCPGATAQRWLLSLLHGQSGIGQDGAGGMKSPGKGRVTWATADRGTGSP